MFGVCLLAVGLLTLWTMEACFGFVQIIPDTYMHGTVLKFIYVPGFAVYQL